MRTVPAVVLILSALAGPATAAGWSVASVSDPMAVSSSPPARVAVLPASTGPGVLRLSCTSADVTYPAPVGVRTVGTNYRFDDSDLVVRFTPVSTDGRTAWLWIGNEAAARRRIAQAKRLRVVAFVPLTGEVFSDFDLTGARETIAALGCR